MATIELDVNEHKHAGPYTDVHGHGPVTAIADPHESPRDDDVARLMVCLDCGYMTTDARQLAHERCEREDNGINQTWRERLTAEPFPPEGDGGELVDD